MRVHRRGPCFRDKTTRVTTHFIAMQAMSSFHNLREIGLERARSLEPNPAPRRAPYQVNRQTKQPVNWQY